MNVSMTEVATTMRTRFESGGTAPEPADILESNNGRYRPGYKRACSQEPRKFLKKPSSKPSFSVLFQHALGCFYGRNNNHGHGADQPGKKEVLKNRKNMVDQEVHDCNCSPVAERNQRRSAVC
jgi:hypothetical protein